MDKEITFFGPLNLFWVTGWIVGLLTIWMVRRPRHHPWAWAQVISRWGNPGIVVAPGPSMLGDTLHYEDYAHLLQDVKMSLLAENDQFIDIKLLYAIIIEKLVFLRVCSTVHFFRNICFLIIYVYASISNTRNEDSIANDIINHETAIGVPHSEELTVILFLIDLIRTSLIMWMPDMLMPSNLQQAILINITLLVRLQML